MFDYDCKLHQYYLSSMGSALKDKYYISRHDAEKAMHKYCDAHNLKVECVERNRHSRLYKAQNGVSFCINRV